MKTTIADDGSAQFTNADEGLKNPDGSHAVSNWSTRDADQAGKLLPTVSATMQRGDISAVRDAANELQKQIDS